MLWRRKRNVHERPPLRPLRLADETHVRFLRKPVAFARVTGNAGTNHIFPCRHSAAVPRHDMIEIQVTSLKNLSAILTDIFVALENIVARKLHFLFRETVEKQQHDHARDANLPRNGRHHFVFWRCGGKIAPTLEIVSQKIVGFIRGDDLGVACINQREGAPGRADVHRLPQAIKDQNVTV